jgi:transcriptional regulator with XRE-family HTH domain
MRQSDISRIERDQVALPYEERLERIAAALNLRLDQLPVRGELDRHGTRSARCLSATCAGDASLLHLERIRTRMSQIRMDLAVLYDAVIVVRSQFDDIQYEFARAAEMVILQQIATPSEGSRERSVET